MKDRRDAFIGGKSLSAVFLAGTLAIPAAALAAGDTHLLPLVLDGDGFQTRVLVTNVALRAGSGTTANGST